MLLYEGVEGMLRSAGLLIQQRAAQSGAVSIISIISIISSSSSSSSSRSRSRSSSNRSSSSSSSNSSSSSVSVSISISISISVFNCIIVSSDSNSNRIVIAIRRSLYEGSRARLQPRPSRTPLRTSPPVCAYVCMVMYVRM